MPQDASEANRKEVVHAGATLHLVDGLIGEAGRQFRKVAAERGLFDLSTLQEPYRVEGKKTMGYWLDVPRRLGAHATPNSGHHEASAYPSPINTTSDISAATSPFPAMVLRFAPYPAAIAGPPAEDGSRNPAIADHS